MLEDWSHQFICFLKNGLSQKTMNEVVDGRQADIDILSRISMCLFGSLIRLSNATT